MGRDPRASRHCPAFWGPHLRMMRVSQHEPESFRVLTAELCLFPARMATPGNKARDAAEKQMVLTPTTDADELSSPSSPSRHPGTHPMVLPLSPRYSAAPTATPLQQMGFASLAPLPWLLPTSLAPRPPVTLKCHVPTPHRIFGQALLGCH